jgi:hypothetical protein
MTGEKPQETDHRHIGVPIPLKAAKKPKPGLENQRKIAATIVDA